MKTLGRVVLVSATRGRPVFVVRTQRPMPGRRHATLALGFRHEKLEDWACGDFTLQGFERRRLLHVQPRELVTLWPARLVGAHVREL